jgi:hypothetical protein
MKRVKVKGNSNSNSRKEERKVKPPPSTTAIEDATPVSPRPRCAEDEYTKTEKKTNVYSCIVKTPRKMSKRPMHDPVDNNAKNAFFPGNILRDDFWGIPNDLEPRPIQDMLQAPHLPPLQKVKLGDEYSAFQEV